MRVVTPGQAARHTGSKYLGVLVAAKMARNLNELRRNELMEDPTVSRRQRRAAREAHHHGAGRGARTARPSSTLRSAAARRTF